MTSENNASMKQTADIPLIFPLKESGTRVPDVTSGIRFVSSRRHITKAIPIEIQKNLFIESERRSGSAPGLASVGIKPFKGIIVAHYKYFTPVTM